MTAGQGGEFDEHGYGYPPRDEFGELITPTDPPGARWVRVSDELVDALKGTWSMPVELLISEAKHGWGLEFTMRRHRCGPPLPTLPSLDRLDQMEDEDLRERREAAQDALPARLGTETTDPFTIIKKGAGPA